MTNGYCKPEKLTMRAGAAMMAVGLVWLLGHLAFWLDGMHARQMYAQDIPSMEQLPLKSVPMAIARDDSDDSLILSEVEMAAAAMDHSFRAGDTSLVTWQVRQTLSAYKLYCHICRHLLMHFPACCAGPPKATC